MNDGQMITLRKRVSLVCGRPAQPDFPAPIYSTRHHVRTGGSASSHGSPKGLHLESEIEIFRNLTEVIPWTET